MSYPPVMTICTALSRPVYAQDNAEDLAKDPANPLARLGTMSILC